MHDELVKRLRTGIGGPIMAKEYIDREAPYKFMFDIPNPNGAGEIEVVSVDDLDSIPAVDVEELSKPHWIPVAERLPEEDTICILTDGVSNAIGYRGKVFGFHLIWTADSPYLKGDEVTHWMPLPKPPKEVTRKPIERTDMLTKLDIAKQIIKEYSDTATYGIYNSRNISGDPMTNIYDDGELSIDICYHYEYFEVFGLSENDFADLKSFYRSLVEEGET